MASEVRVNQIQNRSGLGTITVADSGVVISGITTISDLRTSGGALTVGTGASISSPATNVLTLGTNNTESVRITSGGNVGINSTIPKSKLDVGGTIFVGRNDSSSEGGEIAFCKSLDNSSAWSVDVYGSTSTPSLRFIDNTAGVARMSIDGSGRMTLPYQPSFHATGSAGGISFSGSLKIPYDTEFFDVGGNYDPTNSRFTAPVAGKYFFYASYLTFPNADPAYVTMVIAKNGTSYYGNGFKRATNSAQEDRNLSTILDLAQNDYIEVYAEAGGTSYYYTASGHAHFFGYLIG